MEEKDQLTWAEGLTGAVSRMDPELFLTCLPYVKSQKYLRKCLGNCIGATTRHENNMDKLAFFAKRLTDKMTPYPMKMDYVFDQVFDRRAAQSAGPHHQNFLAALMTCWRPGDVDVFVAVLDKEVNFASQMGVTIPYAQTKRQVILGAWAQVQKQTITKQITEHTQSSPSKAKSKM